MFTTNPHKVLCCLKFGGLFCEYFALKPNSITHRSLSKARAVYPMRPDTISGSIYILTRKHKNCLFNDSFSVRTSGTGMGKNNYRGHLKGSISAVVLMMCTVISLALTAPVFPSHASRLDSAHQDEICQRVTEFISSLGPFQPVSVEEVAEAKKGMEEKVSSLVNVVCDCVHCL